MNIEMLTAFTAQDRPKLTADQLARSFGDTWKQDLTYLIKDAGVKIGQFRDPATQGIYFQLKSSGADAAPASSSPASGSSAGDSAGGHEEAPADAPGTTDEQAPPSSAASPAGPAVASPPPADPEPEVEVVQHNAKPPVAGSGPRLVVELKNFRVTSSGGRPKLTATPVHLEDGAALFTFASQGQGEGEDVVVVECYRIPKTNPEPAEVLPEVIERMAEVAKDLHTETMKEAADEEIPPAPIGDPVGPAPEELAEPGLEDLPVEEALPANTETISFQGGKQITDEPAAEPPAKTKEQLAKEIADQELPESVRAATIGMMEGGPATEGSATGGDQRKI